MTPQEIIIAARFTMNDTDAVLYRQSDAEMLGYVNDAVMEVSVMRPDLFTTVGDLLCTVSSVEQEMSGATAQAVIDILGIKNGASVTEFDFGTMQAYNPGWRTDTAAAISQWARYPGSPRKFYIYPQAPLTPQTLSVSYVKVPSSLAIGDTISDILPSMKSALTDYVVSRASQKDDEYVNSGRPAADYAAFSTKIKGAQ